MRTFIGALIGLITLTLGAAAQDYLAVVPSLQERLTPDVLAHVFQGATRIEPLDDGGPPAVAAYAQASEEDEGELVGYIFSTLDVLRAPGYASTPFDIVAGVTLGGRITGAALLFHREPYLLNDERRSGQMVHFLDVMAGMEARLGAAGGLEPEYVAGATISARAMRNAVLEGARIVLRFRNEAAPVTEPTIDMLNFRPKTAAELIVDGGLANILVTNAGLRAAMEAAGLGDLEPQVLPRGGPGSIYLDLRAGYANPPTIGRNSVGQGAYDRLYEPMRGGRHVIVLGSNGAYDFRGTQYNNLTHGFRLERIAITQGENTFTFDKSDLVTTDHAIGRVASALLLPEDAEFDAMAPWHVDVYAQARHPDGHLEPFHLTRLEYQLPARYILMPEGETMAAWMEPWIAQRGEIAILGSALGVLTLILGFQEQLTRRRTLHRWVRMGFLGFTLVWIGWIASAQLSIVNVINYLKGPFQNLGLAFYLAEPLIVIISIYTAVSLILLGRGVFCGWLCPFGALQELLAHVGRFFRMPQWNPTEAVQRRLWWGKYASLVVVVGLAFVAPAAGAVAAEVEPFKTAITAIFLRGWPYVVYATILLMIGLFTERAFCRFLCPLGGALAVLDRLHLIDLLKRRPECGSPCHLCERSCPVKAIERSGKIKMAECFQCLDCMVEYHDDRRCPPLAKLRKQHERAQGIPGRPAPRPARANPVPRPIAARIQPAE